MVIMESSFMGSGGVNLESVLPRAYISSRFCRLSFRPACDATNGSGRRSTFKASSLSGCAALGLLWEVSLTTGSALAPRRSPLAEGELSCHATRLYIWIFAVGVFGALLRIHDRYVQGGRPGLPRLGAREALVESSGSAFSLVGGISYSFGYVSLFLIPVKRIYNFTAFTFFFVLCRKLGEARLGEMY